MQNYTGVVSEKSYKDFTDRKTGADIVLKSFRVDGNGKWFRTGTEDLPHPEGTPIRFSANPQNGQVDLKTVTVVDQQDVQAAPKPPARQGGGGGYQKKGGENWEARQKYWENKEERDIEVVEPRITFSAAQRDAITVITSALANDCLSFGNSAKGKRLDMLLGYIDQVAHQFYEQRFNGTFKDAGATTLSNAAGSSEDYDE